MAEQIIKRLLCDRHLVEKDEETEAQSYVVALDGKAAGRIELCDSCAAPLLQVADLLKEYGRPDTARKPAKPSTSSAQHGGAGHAKRAEIIAETGGHPCPVCDWVSTSRGGLGSHLRTHHDMTMTEALGKGTADTPCPVDGCSRMFVGQMGLTTHLRGGHPDFTG